MCTTSMYWALKGFCSREHSSQRHTNSFFSPWMCSLLMCCTHTITHIYNHKHTITHTQSHTFTITHTQTHSLSVKLSLSHRPNVHIRVAGRGCMLPNNNCAICTSVLFNIVIHAVCTSGDSRKLYMGWQKGGKLKIKGGISHTHTLFFSFTPIKIKLYTMKVPMKIKMFCITSFF